LLLKDAIKEDFESHRSNLDSFYPGIKIHQVSQGFQYFCDNYSNHSFFLTQWFGGRLREKWDQFFKQLKAGIPLEIISERAFFIGHEYWLRQGVLFPRFETELIYEAAMNFLNNRRGDLKVCEVGVGPGTISLALARDCSPSSYSSMSSLTFDCGDIDDTALDICRINTFRHNPYFGRNSVYLFKSDRLTKMPGPYDLIVSNPPYIMEKEDQDLVHTSVLQYEPKQALFLNDDEYFNWFEEFFTQVEAKLKPNGLFLMEGHERHLKKLLPVAKRLIKGNALIIKDLSQRDRLLEFRKSNG